MKKLLLIFIGSSFTLLNAQFVIFQENFDLAPDFLGNGWLTDNKSNPMGASDWTQGNGVEVGAIAYNGDTTEYCVTDFNATTGAGDISDWLMSPVITFNNGDTVSFYTISYNSHTYPDRLECRLSTNGTGSSTGADETTVGDFTVSLVTVNPSLDTVSYPSVAVDGATWTRFTGVVSGLGGPTQGRIGFRYYVTNAGPSGINSSTIALDAVSVISSIPSGVETELGSLITLYPNPTTNFIYITLTEQVEGRIYVYDMHGKTILIQNIVTQNNSVDVSALAAGSYLVKIQENNTGKYAMRTIVKN